MADGPVVFLVAALGRAEELARAATEGPWKAHRYTWDGDGFDASIGHYSEADVVGHGYEGGGVVEWADAEFIEANNPNVVLRLVTGARQILAEHADEGGECRACAAEGDGGGITFLGNVPSPCRTVRLLAEAWGWEETA